jgi:hypothetical protein
MNRSLGLARCCKTTDLQTFVAHLCRAPLSNSFLGNGRIRQRCTTKVATKAENKGFWDKPLLEPGAQKRAQLLAATAAGSQMRSIFQHHQPFALE